MIKIILEGSETEVDDGTTVDDIYKMKKRLGRCAVFVNDKMVRQSDYQKTCVADGDDVKVKRVGAGG